jgi:hypothetical protein
MCLSPVFPKLHQSTNAIHWSPEWILFKFISRDYLPFTIFLILVYTYVTWLSHHSQTLIHLQLTKYFPKGCVYKYIFQLWIGTDCKQISSENIRTGRTMPPFLVNLSETNLMKFWFSVLAFGEIPHLANIFSGYSCSPNTDNVLFSNV